MKTSLGIWALGPMITRFVPGGYQPDRRDEPVAEKVHRAVAGLGDLMDDYEFHYPGELNRDNLDEVRAALDGHGVYCLAAACTWTRALAREGSRRSTIPCARRRCAFCSRQLIWPATSGRR